MNVAAENLSFQFATSTDYDEIEELIFSSFKTPIRIALNIERHDMVTFIPQTIKECLSSNLSIMVKNVEKKIIAVQLVTVHNRNDCEPSHDDTPSISPTEKAAKVIKFLTYLERNFWDLVPADVERLLRIDMTLVLPEYQRLGIARRMSAMLFDVARELSYQGITTNSVSYMSQNLRLSQGFLVLKEVKYNDWLYENGAVIIDVKDSSSDGVIVTLKRL